MSKLKKLARKAAMAKREEEQGKRAIKGLVGALILLTIISLVAFAVL
ncbi:MAG: hypothetical protein II222_07230 [Paraprevotella sp.]|nr:hypothetical protein [Paraprevotella sp.]